MPELPEVEVTRAGISSFICDNTVTGLTIYTSGLRWPISIDLADLLIGQKIQSIERRGKYLLLHCHTGVVLIHLGMTGFLQILPEFNPPGKHDHYDLVFINGVVLRFNDVRKFGSILWAGTDPHIHKLLAKLGPEPFSENFDGTYLHKISRNRKISIKQLIMDSKVVVGVGNIYANESLFYAGINPTISAGQLSLSRNKQLVNAIKTVLADSIKIGGTMLDFRDGTEKMGYFQKRLAVYKRDGLPCTKCSTPIQLKRIGQRSIYFCSNCQQ